MSPEHGRGISGASNGKAYTVNPAPSHHAPLIPHVLDRIPRWRDKLVIEAWSLGTFMRLDLEKKQAAEVAAKAKETNEKEWQATQEGHKSGMGQERRAMRSAAQEQAGRVKDEAEERRQVFEDRQKTRLKQTVAVMREEADKIVYFQSKVASYAADESGAEQFERGQREKRFETMASRKNEMSRAAHKSAVERQVEFMTDEEKQAARLAERLALERDEKRQALAEEDARVLRERSKMKQQREQVFQARDSARQRLEEDRERKQQANDKQAYELLQVQWEEEKKAARERADERAQRTTMMRETAIASHEFRVQHDREVAEVWNGVAEWEKAERTNAELMARHETADQKARREAQAQTLRESEKHKSELAEKRAAREAREAKKLLAEEAKKKEATEAQHRAEFARIAAAEVKAAEAKRVETERTQAAIQKRRNAEMDGTLRRMQTARQEYAEAKSPPRQRPMSPLEFRPAASPEAPVSPM